MKAPKMPTRGGRTIDPNSGRLMFKGMPVEPPNTPGGRAARRARDYEAPPSPSRPAPRKHSAPPEPKHKYNSGYEKAMKIMGEGDKPKKKMKKKGK